MATKLSHFLLLELLSLRILKSDQESMHNDLIRKKRPETKFDFDRNKRP